MKLSEVKSKLHSCENIQFQLPDGAYIPAHFHVTEIGTVTRRFIDCGGTVRSERAINFQLWEADDYNHRLSPQKLLSIIETSEKVLKLPNFEVEVEYQANTIARYGLSSNNDGFVLTTTQTDCLAKDKCGIPPQQKKKVKLSELGKKEEMAEAACVPGSGCC